MLRLRPYKNCDAKYIVSWIENEFAFRQWCADRYESYPITENDINKQYAGFSDADNFYEMTAFEILKVKKVTLGVFENNPAAYWCYKSVGFSEVTTEKEEYYHVLNEDWKCIEMEVEKYEI